jgi:cysteine desulfurase/selenocysteine lyase
VIGPSDAYERGGIMNFTVDNMNAHDVAYLLNKCANIMVRAGKHCVHSWFNATGCSESVRASFSFYNTPEEVEFFCWTMRDIVRMYGK